MKAENFDNRPSLPSPLILPFPVHVLDPLGADDWACQASLVETHSPTQYETLLVLKPAAARRSTGPEQRHSAGPV